MSQVISARPNTCESGHSSYNEGPCNMEVEELGYDDLSPSFADLPMEIILNIFRYLNFGDIRSASLTCRRWCEASQDSEFQSKVQLKFSKIYLSDNSLPGTLFLNSFRPFPNIYLFETILGSVDNFFSHIGSTVEHIIIESVDITEKQFNAILKETPNLKALTITDCFSLFMTGQFFESEADREALAESLRNVKDISLGMNQYLSDAILLRLTSLTPNLERLDLHGCHIAYHTAIQRRFYPPDRADYPSESILTFKFLLNVIENHVGTLKDLNLSNTLVGGSSLSLLANIKGLDLRRIDFISCRQLNFTGLDILLKSQKGLVELNLSQSHSISDRSMEMICEQLTNLKVLKLQSCYKISNASITGVSKLKRLKVLDISHCDLITSDGVQQGVAKAKNNSLRELYLSRIDLCEACLIQCAENLPNLRVFDVSYCVNGVTDKAVQAIIKNLLWLRVLSMDGCSLITDAAITGINVKGQLSNETAPCASSSIADINVSVRLDDISCSNNRYTISLRSKAEQDIIEDAKRKKAMLAIYEMNQVDDRIQDGLSIKELKGLQALHLKGCSRISDVSLKYGLKFLELRQLMLSNCQQISLTGMQALVENCPSIEMLDLSECYNINDKCIEVISRCLQRLQLLNISGCNQLTDHSLDYIVINCKVLQILAIRHCRRMCSDVELRLSCLSTLRLVHRDRASSMDNVDIFRVKNYGLRWDY